MKLLISCLLVCMSVLTIARDSPAIAARQVTRQKLIQRATRTRFRRQGGTPSAIVAPPTCDPNLFHISLSPTEYLYLDNAGYVQVGDPAVRADTFILDGGNVQVTTVDPVDVLATYGNTYDYVTIYDAIATPLSCALSGTELICQQVNTIPSTEAVFQTCPDALGTYFMYGMYPDASCVTRTLTAVSVCP